jgi:hypothetical protein
MYTKLILLWLPMIVIAFVNAALRELVFIKQYSELRAHQLSTLTLIVFCSVYTWFIFPQLNIQHSQQALLAGFVWVVLTVLFEFSLGRLTNKSWEYLLENYNIAAGRIWSIFLLCLLLMPYVLYSIRNRS